jgi:hypothetical protein
LTVKSHQASLFGLVAVAALRGTPAAAQGELLRFLAEAAWYPTALLPSQGVAWAAVDAAAARATLRDGGTTATLLVRFTADGLIASVRAEARGRLVAGAVVPTPWEAAGAATRAAAGCASRSRATWRGCSPRGPGATGAVASPASGTSTRSRPGRGRRHRSDRRPPLPRPAPPGRGGATR